MVESPRIQRAKSIAAYPLAIFQHQAELRLKGQIRLHKNPAQRVRVIAIERFAILSKIARLQADMAGGSGILGAGGPNQARFWRCARFLRRRCE